MHRTWLRYLVWALIPALGYIATMRYQSWRGEQALSAAALPFLPLADALAEAQRSGKPVLADFSAIWCPSCRRLHGEVFTDAAVRAALTERYVLARIEDTAADGPALMARYGIRGYPTLLVLDASGRVEHPLPLSFDPQVFLAGLVD